jgi:hypothetical protein
MVPPCAPPEVSRAEKKSAQQKQVRRETVGTTPREIDDRRCAETSAGTGNEDIIAFLEAGRSRVIRPALRRTATTIRTGRFLPLRAAVGARDPTAVSRSARVPRPAPRDREPLSRLCFAQGSEVTET